MSEFVRIEIAGKSHNTLAAECRKICTERMLIMGTEFENKHIGCTIHNCVNHCCGEDYCSLDKIEIGTHEANPSQVQCTDCLSFKAKPGV